MSRRYLAIELSLVIVIKVTVPLLDAAKEMMWFFFVKGCRIYELKDEVQSLLR